MREIKLTRGAVTLVDDDDYDLLMQWKWFKHEGGYACRSYYPRNESGKRLFVGIKMHRIITKCPPNLQVDHINGDGLDNRKENLRVCTQHQNSLNKRKSNPETSYSIYKGVTFRKDRKERRWNAQITRNNKRKHLGYFNTEIEAALAYNAAALKFEQEFTRINDLTDKINYYNMRNIGNRETDL